MLNFRQERTPDPKDPRNPAPGRPNTAPPLTPSAPATPAPRGAATTPAPSAATSAPAASTTQVVVPTPSGDSTGSKLSIGVNINVKGVEISNCDVLVIEGNVEATINSKAMEISKPGRLNGTAIIDVAEIHGEFSGELTARTRLVVHATGRVTGTIHYGKLVVAEGGMLTGELKQLPGHDEPAASAPARDPLPARETAPLLSPQPR